MEAVKHAKVFAFVSVELVSARILIYIHGHALYDSNIVEIIRECFSFSSLASKRYTVSSR
jgi:hypothetical protein